MKLAIATSLIASAAAFAPAAQKGVSVSLQETKVRYCSVETGLFIAFTNRHTHTQH